MCFSVWVQPVWTQLLGLMPIVSEIGLGLSQQSETFRGPRLVQSEFSQAKLRPVNGK